MSNDTPARSPSSGEDFPFRTDIPAADPYIPPNPQTFRRPRFQHRWWKHILLFLLTLGTTTLTGACHYGAFLSDFGRRTVRLNLLDPDVLLSGLWYSGTLLLILGAHELGHYYYCRRYNVDATLPYFIPAPLPLTGTLGAVIRIREPFPTRSVLFDIGVAGPIAGFVVLLPALFVGLALSHVTPSPPRSETLVSLGEPLLFQLGSRVMFGTLPDGYTINMHPIVFASWFGMLATALNLLPFGQLDGGHITYAALGRWSTPISLVTVFAAVFMTFVSSSWMFMAFMMVMMLVFLGPRHPRVLHEVEPLAPGRRLVALFALMMLVVCFTPVPIEPYDLIRNP